MHASIGQYSMHAGEPEQPVQQSVVMASMRGRFLRCALPSPSDIGQCFSTMSYIVSNPRVRLVKSQLDSNIALRISSTICVGAHCCLLVARRWLRSSSYHSGGNEQWKQYQAYFDR